MADVFGTAEIRHAVLDAWSQSATRLREDSNLEEDFAHAYYGDRVVIELAQNAADAATRSGERGRLLLELLRDGSAWTLRASNSGEPLTSQGVLGLASLRASSKAELADGETSETVGHFGVGFAAIRAVSDHVVVASTSGAVLFDSARAAELIESLPRQDLREESDRRGPRVPMLRLPFETSVPDGDIPNGFTTTVSLRLRDDEAVARVRDLLAAVDDALLLALPALSEVTVVIDGDERRLANVEDRWTIARRGGRFTDAALAERPVEERARSSWSLTWAYPREQGNELPGVILAPTPTDEPCSIPAILIGSFPLDPSRRHIAQGTMTSELIKAAAGLYGDLAESIAAETSNPRPVMALVPLAPALSGIEAGLQAQILNVLQGTPLLSPVTAQDWPDADAARDVSDPDSGCHPPHPSGADGNLAHESSVDLGPRGDFGVDDGPAKRLRRPSDVVTLTGPGSADLAVIEAAAHIHGNLVPARTDRDARALAALGVGQLTLGDIVDAAPTAWPARRWARWLRTIEPAAQTDPLVREQLSAVPVPLADGRVVRGARGALVPSGGLPSAALGALSRWGVRVVDPELPADVLGLLGAETVDAQALLSDSSVRDAVLARIEDALDGQLDEDFLREDNLQADPVASSPLDNIAATFGIAAEDVPLAKVTAVVLDLLSGVELAHPVPELAWLGELPVPVIWDDGEPDPLVELAPASSAVLPSSEWSRLIDSQDAPTLTLSASNAFPQQAWIALGVRCDVVGHPIAEVYVDRSEAFDSTPDDAEEFSEWPDYVRALAESLPRDIVAARAVDVVALPNLDLVRDVAWPDALASWVQKPLLRKAMMDPVWLTWPGGRVQVPSYSSWWLGRHREDVVGAPGLFASAEAPRSLRRWSDPLPAAWVQAGRSADVAAIVGIARSWEDLRPEQLPAILTRAADAAADGELSPGALASLWRGVIASVGALPDDDPQVIHHGSDQVVALSGRLPVWRDGAVAVADARDVCLCDEPQWLQIPGEALIPVPRDHAMDAADRLGLFAIRSTVPAELSFDQGDQLDVPDDVLDLLEDAPDSWWAHEELSLGSDPIRWWVEGSGPDAIVRAVSMADAASGIAWAARRWQMRQSIVGDSPDPGTLFQD